MLIGIDYETFPISKEYPYPRPVCLSTASSVSTKLLVGDGEISAYLNTILDHTLIAHNATFECGVTYTWYPHLRPKLFKAISEGRVICTQILQQLLNARLEKALLKTSLAACVSHYFNVDLSESKTNPDSWRLRYQELVDVPKEDWPQEAIDYSIMDSVWAFKLYRELSKHKIDYRRAMEASFYLNMIGKIGLRVNNDRVLQLEREVYEKINPCYETLIKEGFCTKTATARPKKNLKKLTEYVQSTIKEPLITPKGNVRTDKEALIKYQLEMPDSQIYTSFQEINEYDKILTAYVKNLKNQKVIFTDYSTAKSTGRTSSFSSKLYPSVNIQQMPRKVPGVTYDVRNCFIPREGYQIVSIDYAGLELASTAHRLYKTFGQSDMRDLLNSGNTPVDLHSMLAARIMSLKSTVKVTYEYFIAHKKEPEYARMRQLCKAINLGFPGGIGYDTMRHILLQNGIQTKYEILVRGKSKEALTPSLLSFKRQEPNLRLSQVGPEEWAIVYDELVSLKSNMFKVYPELQRFLREEHKRFMTGETKFMKDDWGKWEEEPMYKYKALDFERNWCTYTAFCNGYLMQSPSAIGATKMMIELGKRYLDHPNVNLLAFIHDEVLFEVNQDEVLHIKDISEIMIDTMQQVLKSVRITVEASLMDCWSKEGGKYNVTYFKDSKNPILKEV